MAPALTYPRLLPSSVCPSGGTWSLTAGDNSTADLLSNMWLLRRIGKNAIQNNIKSMTEHAVCVR